MNPRSKPLLALGRFGFEPRSDLLILDLSLEILFSGYIWRFLGNIFPCEEFKSGASKLLGVTWQKTRLLSAKSLLPGSKMAFHKQEKKQNLPIAGFNSDPRLRVQGQPSQVLSLLSNHSSSPPARRSVPAMSHWLCKELHTVGNDQP